MIAVDTSDVLGDLLIMAKYRFSALEQKLAKNKKLKTIYFDFMNEYCNFSNMG